MPSWRPEQSQTSTLEKSQQGHPITFNLPANLLSNGTMHFYNIYNVHYFNEGENKNGIDNLLN